MPSPEGDKGPSVKVGNVLAVGWAYIYDNEKPIACKETPYWEHSLGWTIATPETTNYLFPFNEEAKCPPEQQVYLPCTPAHFKFPVYVALYTNSLHNLFLGTAATGVS